MALYDYIANPTSIMPNAGMGYLQGVEIKNKRLYEMARMNIAERQIAVDEQRNIMQREQEMRLLQRQQQEHQIKLIEEAGKVREMAISALGILDNSQNPESDYAKIRSMFIGSVPPEMRAQVASQIPENYDPIIVDSLRKSLIPPKDQMTEDRLREGLQLSKEQFYRSGEAVNIFDSETNKTTQGIEDNMGRLWISDPDGTVRRPSYGSYMVGKPQTEATVTDAPWTNNMIGAPTKAESGKAYSALALFSENISRGKEVINLIDKNPGAVGVPAEISRTLADTVSMIGGSIGMRQTDLKSIHDQIWSGDKEKTYTAIRAFTGALVPVVTNDTSGRYSDTDLERAKEINNAANLISSPHTAKAALGSLVEIMENGFVRQAYAWGQTIPPGYSDAYDRVKKAGNIDLILRRSGKPIDPVIKKQRTLPDGSVAVEWWTGNPENPYERLKYAPGEEIKFPGN